MVVRWRALKCATFRGIMGAQVGADFRKVGAWGHFWGQTQVPHFWGHFVPLASSNSQDHSRPDLRDTPSPRNLRVQKS